MERKHDPQTSGQEEPLGQMLKGNQGSREGQRAWLRASFHQEQRQPLSPGIFPVTQMSTAPLSTHAVLKLQ